MVEAPELPVEEIEVPKVDRQIFNHLAAGIPITMPLLPQGIGVIEVATTFTPYMQLRLGYTQPLLNVIPALKWGDINGALAKAGVGNLPNTVDVNGTQINLAEASLKTDTNMGGLNFFFDVFPGRKTPFHFTFGLYYNPFSTTNDILGFAVDMSSPLKDAGFTPGKYNEVYFGFDENDPDFRVSPDKNGVLRGGVMGCIKIGDGLYPLPVHPYVGIGSAVPSGLTEGSVSALIWVWFTGAPPLW